MKARVSSWVDVKAGKKLQGACQQTWEIIEGDFKEGDQQAAAQLCCGVLLMGCSGWVDGSICCCALLCSPPPVKLLSQAIDSGQLTRSNLIRTRAKLCGQVDSHCPGFSNVCRLHTEACLYMT